MISPQGKFFGRALALGVTLLLATLAACANAPHVIAIIDAGVGWAQLDAATFPPGAALAGMSDPATEHGWAGALISLGAGGRGARLPWLTPESSIRLSRTPTGRWQLPPVLWHDIDSANQVAFAGSRLGNLGSALSGRRRIVLIASQQRVAQVALVAADREGMVDVWLPAAGNWTDPRLDGAVVFMAPPAGDGLALLQTVAQRFPATPIFYFCACPAETRHGEVRDLTPVVLLGKGGGLLASRRTRWHGVVNALDFAPTLLQLAGVPASDVSLGMPLTIAADASPAQRVRRIAAQARAAYPAIISLDIIYFFLMGLIFFAPVLNVGGRSPLTRGVMTASWMVPILLVFVLPHCWFLPLSLLIALMLLCWLLLGIPFQRLPAIPSLAWAAGIGTTALLVNVFFAASLAPQPYLGYFLVTGYRYYGIGNETMGVLMVMLTVFIGWLLSRYPSRHALIIFGSYAVAAIGLGATWWGAKWGGAVTAVFAALLFALLHYLRRPRWWHIPAALLTTLLAGAALIALLAIVYPYVPNHPGALGREIAGHGLAPLWTMIGRKLSFAARMWFVSQGWIAVPGGVGFLIVFSWFHRRIASRVMDPALNPLWESIYVAWWCAVLAGLVNDNGIGVTGLMWLTLAPAAGALIYQWRTLTGTVSRANAPSPPAPLSEERGA